MHLTACREEEKHQHIPGSGSSFAPAGGVGQAHAEVAGQLTTDEEPEALCTQAVCALLQGKGRGPALGRHNAGNASPAHSQQSV